MVVLPRLIGLTERSLGCILGGAIGDAMGYPVEFKRIKEIKSLYGPSGITEPEEYKGFYRFSDDTQMTVLTAYGLLFAETRLYSYGLMSHPMDYAWPAYRRWAVTQGEHIDLQNDHVPWVLEYDSMKARRTPGSTCLESIRNNPLRCVKERPVNFSKGCGGLMRAAPAPIWSWKNMKEADASMDLAADVAAATHSHPLGWLTAAFLGSLIHHILDRVSLEDSVLLAVNDCRKKYSGEKYLGEMLSLIDKAIAAAGSEVSDEEGMTSLGEGWIAEQTLALAVFACLRHPDDFGTAIRAAVNITGDSDSVGSVVGNIMGAYLGIDAVRKAFDIQKLEDYEMLEEIASDLATACPLERSSSATWRWEYKYTLADDYVKKMQKKGASTDESMIREAVDEALEAERSKHGGPFGCVIAEDGRIVGRGHSMVFVDNDPTAHGEIIAIREACRALGTSDLHNCILYASSEPCPMCKAALSWAKIGRVVFAASMREVDNVCRFKDMDLSNTMMRGNDPVFIQQLRVENGLEPVKEYKRNRH